MYFHFCRNKIRCHETAHICIFGQSFCALCTQQPSQHGRPMINSAARVLYALSPQRGHGLPVVYRDGSPIIFQVTNL